jgi:uncharacterized protein (DUF3084 family)
MMFRFVAAAFTVFGLAAAASAQEIPAADTYKVAFENDHVRIERAHYPANAKIASHAHPPSNTVYVYLNDSEGVIFRHTAGSSHTVTRQPVKTGSLRISGGGNEHHSAENTSKTASDFLRVVLKTQTAGGRSGGRMTPTDMQYANSQIRINRLLIAQHQSATLSGDVPSIVIEVPSGSPDWLDAGASRKFENHDARDLMLVRIEFLTKPR